MTRLLSVVSQDYVARVHEIDVILGNAGLLKCEIPSFVIDFVSVINWVNDQGEELFSAQNSIGKQSSLLVLYKKNHMTWETQAKLSSFKLLLVRSQDSGWMILILNFFFSTFSRLCNSSERFRCHFGQFGPLEM